MRKANTKIIKISTTTLGIDSGGRSHWTQWAEHTMQVKRNKSK